jgi:hypothetical protein
MGNMPGMDISVPPAPGPGAKAPGGPGAKRPPQDTMKMEMP